MSKQIPALLARRFPESRQELVIGGVPIQVLAGIYDTPFFAYDLAAIDAQLDALRWALPPQFTVYYSIKANPNPAIVSHFLTRGCGLEVASAGEFQTALEAGCSPKEILFAGPGKTRAELEFVLSHGIGEIHIESLLEARRIGQLARQLGTRAAVAIRVNPAGEAEGGAMRMGGRPTPFGVDEEILEQAIDAVEGESSLEFRGIHLFIGTQILDPEVLVNQYRHGLVIARRAAQYAKKPLSTVDFGGGLGIPYFQQEKALDLARVKEGLAEVFAGIERDPLLASTHFLVEPGRFLVGESGVYVARVNDVKISRGKRFVILDGGMHHHLAASGNLGQTIKRNYPVAVLNKLDAPATDAVDVVGPLCTPLDTLARSVELPTVEVGDLVGIFQSGAYGRSASPLGFLSHPAPTEILVDHGKYCVIQDRGAVKTFGGKGCAVTNNATKD
jgi:diaminopimelate decarboxylase